jgi:hypothetical protein
MKLQASWTREFGSSTPTWQRQITAAPVLTQAASIAVEAVEEIVDALGDVEERGSSREHEPAGVETTRVDRLDLNKLQSSHVSTR